MRTIASTRYTVLNLTDWSHVAQDLGTIDSDPIKRGVWENVAKNRLSCLATRQRYPTHMLFLLTNVQQNKFLHGVESPRNIQRKFLREETIHSSESDELRKCTGQTKTVRQPRGLATDSKPALEEPLTEDELTSETFAGRHVCVVLDPGTADRMELSFEDLGLDTFEQFWVELFQPLVLLHTRHPLR